MAFPSDLPRPVGQVITLYKKHTQLPQSSMRSMPVHATVASVESVLSTYAIKFN